MCSGNDGTDLESFLKMRHWNRFFYLPSCFNLAFAHILPFPCMYVIPVPSWPVSLWNLAPFSLSLVKFRPLALLSISLEGCSRLSAMLLSLSASLLATCLLCYIIGGPCDVLSAFLLLSPFGYSVGERSFPLGNCSDSVLCLPGWIQFSCPGFDRSPFFITPNILCDDWFGVLSVHLGIASFVFLYSNESA